ncbi:MAG TPA: hypothetical protein VM513_05950 [Kofleriaceae bacterium]|jgi:hypothetical protein|nr:hypothetical protein [Kofleriaceae bacterium]
MKLCLALVSCLLLAAGCKTDQPETAAAAAKETKDPSSETGERKGRSGKIDFQRPRPPRHDEQPALPGDDPTTQDRDDRRAGWEQRRERMEERRKERMAQLDANGDGTLSSEELAAARQQRAQEMHGRFDANGDGKLTAEELGDARMFRRGGGDPAALDTDKNGEISNAELEAGMATMRNRFRRNWKDATGSGSGSAQP